MNPQTEAAPLVTGATGFAGGHLLERLCRQHPHVVAWAHSSAPAPTDSQVTWQQVDIVNAASVRAAVRSARPAVIYHCAGLPHVAESWRNAAHALQVNVMGTHHLLEAVEAEVPECKVVVVGSALVYKPSEHPLREVDPLAPSNPYGISKLAQEMVGLRAATFTIIARPFNHAGPRQQAAFVTSSFAKQIAEIEAGLMEPTLRVGNLDARRDLTDVRDTVRAYEALARSGAPGRPYNICSGVAHRVGDLLELLLQRARTRVSVVLDPARLRPSDNPVVLGDPGRLQQETGWRPEIPIEQTMDDLLAWWRTQITRRAS